MQMTWRSPEGYHWPDDKQPAGKLCCVLRQRRRRQGWQAPPRARTPRLTSACSDACVRLCPTARPGIDVRMAARREPNPLNEPTLGRAPRACRRERSPRSMCSVYVASGEPHEGGAHHNGSGPSFSLGPAGRDGDRTRNRKARMPASTWNRCAAANAGDGAERRLLCRPTR